MSSQIWITSLVGWLVSGMSALVCAVIYWCLEWVYPWFQSVMLMLPTWLTTAPAKIVNGVADLYRIANVFLPLEEALPMLLALWGFRLAMKIYMVVNSLRKL